MRKVRVGDVEIGGGAPLVLIAGPCVMESAGLCFTVAGAVKEIAVSLGIPYIFKASYDKANRSSPGSFRGPGIEDGLRILAEVKRKCSLPVLVDVHSVEEVGPAAAVADVIQIPAFLCRQTDLVTEAAKLSKAVNIKKGQFVAPWNMEGLIRKAEKAGNRNIMVTERGFSFGYNNLVNDMRSLVIMRKFGYPVVFDATHSTQLPGGLGNATGGERQYVFPLSRAAVATGCDALFLEIHPDPEAALCDGPNQLPIGDLEELLECVMEIDKIVKSR